MVFEKKQLSKVLAIALMVACAVAFMPLLNGQVFAAKKPGKAKITSLEQADTANDDGTYAVTVAYKAKKAKKYQVSYTDGTEAKTMKTKKKSVSFNGTVDSTYTVKVRGIKGKKKGKWSAAQEIKVEKKTPGPTGKMEITGVSQSGAKQLKVTFGTAVADPSALKFTVTRDGKEISATAKADPDDPNSVLLDLDSTIVKDAKYDVAVATADGTPVPTAAGAQTDVQGEEGVVTSIEVAPDLVKTKDALDEGETTYEAKTSFVIKNQFGEDVTAANYSDMNISCTLGTVDQPTGTAKGEIKVTGIQPTLAIPGTKGTIVAVYKKTGVTTSQEVTIGAASKITEITVKGIYNKKGEEAALIAKTALNGEYIAFEMKDQYGNAMTAPAAAQKLTPTMVAGLTNLAAGAIDTKTIDDVQYYAIPLSVQPEKALAAGDASVIIVANETGAKAEYAFKVSDENVIANLTITPPAQVIGGKNAVFTVEATNAAGEAITDYAMLKDGIKLPGTNGNDDQNTGTWKWKKLKDGSGELSLDAKSVSEDTLTSAIFQTVDTYKTTYFTFTILTGVGVPYEITDITTEAEKVVISEDVEQERSDKVKLKELKIADVYGDAVATTAATGYTVKISQPDYTQNSKAVVKYAGTADGVQPEPVGPEGVTIALNDINNISVEYVGTEEGSAIAKVNAVLVKDKKPVLTSEITKPISVAKTSSETVYDSYVVKLTSDGVVGADGEKAEDIETIYAGTAKGEADGYVYIDEPTVKQFDINVYGLMDGSTREYPVELKDCKVQSAAGLISGGKLVIGTDGTPATGGNPAVAGKSNVAEAGVTEDTISVLIPSKGSAPVATKTVKFASDKPVATFIAGYEKAEGTYGASLDDNDAIDAAGVKAAINSYICDQYGVKYRDGKNPVVEFVSATDIQDNYVDAKTGDTVNYKVDYDGTEYFKFTAEDYAKPFKTINVTVTYGAINADLTLNLLSN